MNSNHSQEKRFHILLADDDRDDRYFFNEALKDVPVATILTTVEDGEKLIDFLLKNSEHLPDVIFLDLNMPKKNGNECLIEIKSNEQIEHIPVIIYSTSLLEEVADLLYQKGAHYYLQKPCFDELPGAIHKILSLLMNNPARPSREKFIVDSLVVN